MRSPHLRYVLILLGGMLAVTLPVLTLNLLLIWQGLAPRNIIVASEWQQRTGGVTSATLTGIDNRPFKVLRLGDRLADINGIILGSSTAMPIAADMFPQPMRMYNFAQNANSLLSIISEMDWLIANADGRNWILVDLDWSLGYLYQQGEPPTADLSAENQQLALLAMSRNLLHPDLIRDALSYPRVAALAGILRNVAASSDPIMAFRTEFLTAGGLPYPCDGGLARDFETSYRGRCMGFDQDGSTGMRALPRVHDASAVLEAALATGSIYRNQLAASQGQPYAPSLLRLAQAAQRLRSRGGEMFFLLPPLLPGLEAAFMSNPQTRAALQRTKAAMGEWAQLHDLTLIDAGASENYGCVPGEFVDAHHADRRCYARIMAAWAERLRRAAAP
ncbi:MAG: hypothetical protein JWR10_2155 [Rubritepida sp.]|nr:hypothetical protein [Rubritepida sp.]